MTSFGSDNGNVLYLIVCAAPPAQQTHGLVDQLQHAGWTTCVILTPAATQWVDVDLLATATGHAVRSEFRKPDEAQFTPRGDAVLVAPASFNTINRCATGANDNLALGLMNEAIGQGIPMAIIPWVDDSLAAHPAYKESLTRLESAGVRIDTPTPEQDIAPAAIAAIGTPPGAAAPPVRSS